MAKSYRDDYTEHEVRAFNAQKNSTRESKTFITLSEEDGVTCPRCKKFLTYIYLARNSKCYSCSTEIEVND
jgi:DNA-directed RNA polymerase subunit RPC12/RpoP